MITFQQALQIAETEISKYESLVDDSLVNIVDQIIEKDYGWIFPYTSRKAWETNGVDHAIGGNSPVFISKWNGQFSCYPTCFTIEGMIDQHEENNKIWILSFTDYAFNDMRKAMAIRDVLGLAIAQIADLKKNANLAFERGSKTRLVGIQNQLSARGIDTVITQAQLSEQTKSFY